MLYLQRIFATLCLSLGLMTAASAADAVREAEQAVERSISSLLVRVNEIKSSYQSDPDFYFSEIEKALADFVDFKEVARGVMARYSTGPSGATDEQLERFAEVFKSSILDFYGSALASYGGERFEILPLRRAPANPENATNVRMVVTTEDRNRVEIQYTMFLSDDGTWKMKNLYVEGVNLRRQYHSRFDALMARNDYDIDKAIDAWTIEE